jgi:hypothetical protein
MRRARRRSRNSFITASPSQLSRGWKVPSSEKAPSLRKRCPCGCHCIRSPLVVIDTTIPGRACAPRRLLMYWARASAAHCERSSRSFRRFRKIPRRRRGMDDMTMRDGGEDLLLQPLGPQELLLLLA